MNGAPTFEVVEGGFTVDPSAVYVDEGGQEDIRGADNFDF